MNTRMGCNFHTTMAAQGIGVQFPLTFRKLVCSRLTQKFRDAVQLQRVQITADDLTSDDLLIRNRYVGINASDINFTAGKK